MVHIDSIDKKIYADEYIPPIKDDMSEGSTVSGCERAVEKTGTSFDRLPLNIAPSRSVILNPSRPPTKVSPVEVVFAVETGTASDVVTGTAAALDNDVVTPADISIFFLSVLLVVSVVGFGSNPSNIPKLLWLNAIIISNTATTPKILCA